MRRILLLLLVFCLSTAVLLFSETVLVFTHNSLNPEEYSVTELQAALEDGVMEAFFDAGHIVFNAGVVEGNTKLSVPSERLSFRLAKSGGALYLLEIDMSYLPQEDSIEITGANYRFYKVDSGTMLTEGALASGDVREKPDTPVEKICTLLGESIASGALATLRL